MWHIFTIQSRLICLSVTFQLTDTFISEIFYKILSIYSWAKVEIIWICRCCKEVRNFANAFKKNKHMQMYPSFYITSCKINVYDPHLTGFDISLIWNVVIHAQYIFLMYHVVTCFYRLILRKLSKHKCHDMQCARNY